MVALAQTTLTSLEDAQVQIASCYNCPLRAAATNVVLGRGNEDARIVVVGDVPGRHDDAFGKPFLGGAGESLTQMLEEAGLSRDDLYLTLGVRCWPQKPNAEGQIVTGKPSAKQIAACGPNLMIELSFLDPVVIVCLGDVGLRAVTGKTGVTALRGEVLSVEFNTRSGVRAVKVIPTFAPTAAYHDPGKRAMIVEDLRRAAREQDSHAIAIVPPTQVDVLDSPEAIHAAVDLLLQQPHVAFDTETAGPGAKGGLDFRVLQPLCISLSYKEGHAFVVPLRGQLALEKYNHKQRTFSWEDLPLLWDAEEWTAIHADLVRLFAEHRGLVAHNGKFDIHVLQRIAVPVVHFAADTMLMHALVDENAPHKLEQLRTTYTSLPFYEGWKSDRKLVPSADAPYAIVPPHILWQYAGADTDVTLRAFHALNPLLDRDEQRSVFEAISMPLSTALTRIEDEGMLVDVQRLWELNAEYSSQIAHWEVELERRAGHPVNLGSTLDKRKLLFDELQLPIVKYTDKGEPSTDKDVIKEYLAKFDHPVLEALAQLQRLYKVRDTYLCGKDGRGGLAQHLDAENRVHTNFQLTMRTGRLSSSQPNLQNIPKKDKDYIVVEHADEEGEEQLDEETSTLVRSLFIAPPGYSLIEADYCLAPGTRVLGTDLRWYPIEDLTIGQEVIGFPETLHKDMKYEPATVVSKKQLVRPCYRITTTRGEVVASAEHLFVAKKLKGGYGSARQWVRADEMQPGYRISFLAEPWEVQDTVTAGYLAGFLDGEGFVSGAALQGVPQGSSVGFGQNPGAVTEHVLELTRSLGLDFVQSSVRENGFAQYRLCGADSLRLLGMVRPVRLLPKARGIWEGRRTWGKRSTPGVVLSVEYLGEQPVVAIGTSTKTLIAEGFLSHNCQLEIKIGAYICNEKVLLDAFESEDFDLHRLNAALVNDIPESEVTSNQRTSAKAVYFSTAYGGGVKAVMKATKWPAEEAKAFLEKLQAAYPATARTRHEVTQVLRRRGYVDNLLGRRRRFPAYASLCAVRQNAPGYEQAWRERGRMERQAYNHLIQSLGSEFLSLATIALIDDPVLVQCQASICLSLHDALYAYAPDEHVVEAAAEIQRVMEQVARDLLDWRLPVDVKIAKRWA